MAIKNGIHHEPITVETTIQTLANKIYPETSDPFTVCTMYLPPSLIFTESDLLRILDQLPSPYILMGDFNSHNPIWGDSRLDAKKG